MATAKNAITKQQQAVPQLKASDFEGNCARVNHVIRIIWGKAVSAANAAAGATGAQGPAGPAGAPGGLGTYTQITPSGTTATPSLSGGSWSVTEVLLNNSSPITIQNVTGGSTCMFWVLVLKQDATGGRQVAFPASGSTYAGVTDQVGALDQTASTYSVLVFVVRPDGKSMLLGVPISGEPY